ncbi:GNAT family N-acetyltransferase [Marilutibacter alkalisoli]|uniref:GNAT family N-acetyltransferase n=1 Tax=Marilutibacter alkalisoli TaxID=2591633 RepID=A0A514BRX7_9GAMM|nr:GNAT family N-acetyltransferase [Lysobacter alkalisoli]QDH69779.1 GNAT family N-acetyltransferase [Lysobacter alkalisoli]
MSDSIRVRHAEPVDAAGLYALFSEAEAYGGTLQPPFPSQAAWERVLADPPRHMVQLVAIDADGCLAGAAGFEVFSNPRRRHAANLGMAVAKRRRGQGIGTRLLQSVIETAERWHGVRRLELEVYTDNAAAIALYERHGFVREGHARGYALRDGAYVDVYLMARLRDRV